ncbi:hypothetical protein PR202_ga26170 [Eleusine coracana subsp. coracana]|uniref:Tify domain-containing protein n=1 Tax=Eleusine coracana subsp. coracana TaxID=191504 RepID=A0AAV5DB73_ELECO|nr:hypothetical protein PR202_ga26170 [Eleusine coracana subsp. coracana]
MPLLLQLPAAAALPGVEINAVRDLLPFLQGVPVTYRFAKHSVELDGIVTASGYACACAASSSCGYSGKVLSALQFEKHAGVVSKNQNGHIFLRNGKSLYELFHALRLVAAEAFPEEFRAAAGVPMTVCAAGASPAPQGTGQGQQPGGMASWEPSGVQVHGVMAELPSAPTQEDVEMLTEEEEAGLCLLGLRESGSSTNSNPICGAQGPVTEEDAAGGDHAMPDVEEIRNVAVENGSGLSSLLAATPIKVSVGETRWQSERSRYQLESYLKDVRGLLTTGLLEDTLRKKDDLDALASDRCSTQRGSVVQEFSLANYLKESPSSSIANLNWSVFKRRSERHVKREVTETSTPSVSGSPDKGIPLFTGTSKKSDSEEAPNENIAGRLGIDGVKPDSPGPTAVTSDSSKHNPINLGMPLPGSATITSEPSPDHSIGSKSKEQKTSLAAVGELLPGSVKACSRRSVSRH